MMGLGANPVAESVYPINVADGDGQPLQGERDYVMHFEADELPPVGAFWSVTMYDAEGYQVANEIDRFAIGDRDGLVTRRRRLAGRSTSSTRIPAPTASPTGCRSRRTGRPCCVGIRCGVFDTYGPRRSDRFHSRRDVAEPAARA